MKLYNTLTRTVEPLKPLAPPAVGMYVCGPTVYDDPHIGHARSAYIFDVLHRYLEFRGFTVKFVRNVTDVDDKIIEKARQELGHGAGGAPAPTVAIGGSGGHGVEELREKCREVAERYLGSYHKVLDRLGILPPDIEPRATQHVIPDSKNVEATNKIDASMTGFIGQLITKNMAYSAGGDVYFPVRKFSEYGKLSNRSLDELKSGARVEPGEHKEDPLDFALWKTAKPNEPAWNSPWGPGRPGWHIECSVMSTAYLGDTFDIHGGGVDLVFPHHENEIAQAQALGKPFAKYWIHNGLLTVNGEKMSKSLGNFITVEQALKECHDQPDVLKVLLLNAHYRSPIDYAPDQVQAAYARWFGLKLLLEYADNERAKWANEWSKRFDSNAIERYGKQAVQEVRDQFSSAMDEDLNTPQALACLDRLVELANGWRREKDLLQEATENSPVPRMRSKTENVSLSLGIIDAAEMLLELGGVLGLFSRYQPLILTQEQQALLAQREEARKAKNFEIADRVRNQFDAMGLAIEDAKTGPVVRRKR